MSPLWSVALLILAGFLGGKVVNRVKLPAVTGYLLAGVLLGGSVLGLVDGRTVAALQPINNIALGLIAFIIGGEFSFSNLKRLGAGVMLIAVFEVLGALAVVTGAMALLFKMPLAQALIFGAISSATAPAATVLVIRELKAKGPLTDTLLAVVAIDDALCVMAFGLAGAVAAILTTPGATLLSGILGPLVNIGGSILLGVLIGVALTIASRRLRNSTDLLVIVVGTVFLSSGAGELLRLSPLLTTMAFGCTLVNLTRERSAKAFAAVKSLDTPIYVAFFTLAGASLELGYLWHVGLIGIGYIVARVVGKAAGAGLGAVMGKSPAVVRNFLGLGLVPQAGVAIGVTMIARQQFPGMAQLLTTVILGSVVVYELVGPVCSKLAITLAGEANGESPAAAAKTAPVSVGR